MQREQNEPNYEYFEYAYDVLDGTEVAGEYIKKACERAFSFFDKYEFRKEEVDRVQSFINHFHHFQGSFNNKPFILTKQQKFLIGQIFGWYYPDTDKRVTNYVLIMMARKNAKTMLFAAIALYMLVADHESAGECDFIANSVAQAHIAFDFSKYLSRQLDPKHKHFQELRDSIKHKKSKSFMTVRASDSTTLDGWNPSFFCLDEIHAMRSSELYDVMVSGSAMRKNPLGICVSTAGFLITGFAYQYRQTCIDILYGLKEDDSQFTLLYELDEGDEWDNPAVWKKANPLLGVTVTEDFLKREIKRAKNNAALRKSVQVKNLNMWIQDGVDTWISDNRVVKASKDVEWDFFKDRITYLGIDLSSVSDFTCVTWMTKDIENSTYYYKTKFYLPESTLHDNVNAELYQRWYQQGYITITPGNCCDYDYILKDILELQGTGIIIDSIHYDPYNSLQFVINATTAGLKMKPYMQSLSNFNKPTKEFERLILQNHAVIDNNPITRWCFTNAVLKYDYNNNCKPVKRGGAESMNKIDAAITHVEALGGYLNSPNAQYENADLTV